jgi:amidase
MARTVTDAAILLGALTGVDPRDDATESSRGKSFTDYTQFLDPNGLRGARIGVARRFFRANAVNGKVLDAALEQLKSLGATLVDFNDDIGRGGTGEWEVLQYEFKDGINAYLAGLGPQSRMRTLEDLIKFNDENRDREMPFFGQETFLKAQAKGPLTDQAYLDAVARCRRLSRDEGIDAAITKNQLDPIVGPSGGPAGPTDHIYGDRESGGGSSSPAAVAGYPNITVPAGQLMGMPVGISFFGRAYSEPVLLKFAFAFEQGMKARRAPKFLPTIG